MSSVLHVISIVFWGLLVLSVLVFIHEGGHFLAARIFGIRVKEFFLGLPCRLKLHHASKKTGTDYGVTPLLLGGYTQVCGMEEGSEKDLARVLACVQEHGVVSHQTIAQELSLEEDDVLEALATLNDWASIEEVPSKELDDDEEAIFYRTLERDANLLTKYDKGHDFSTPETTPAGVSRVPDMDPEAFLASEKTHTYLSRGFFGRFFILVAGAFINILCGFFLLVFVLSAVGTTQIIDTNQIGAVEEGSLADEAGIQAGDKILDVEGTLTPTWTDVATQLNLELAQGDTVTVLYQHDGAGRLAQITPDEPGEKLGVSAQTQTVHLNFLDACKQAWDYIVMTVAYILQLFQPDKIANVISQSTSVVGISVMASSAAAAGIGSILILVAAVSLSLGFMNLLPIPPLDGGKIVIELIQAIIKRPLSKKLVSVLNYIGILLFIILFVVLLRQDIVRFVLGG